MWAIWKERNGRVFKNHTKSLDDIWKIINQNIEETMSLKTWYQEDFPTIPQEQSIWNNWKFHRKQEHLIKGPKPPRGHSPEKWLPPPMNMYTKF